MKRTIACMILVLMIAFIAVAPVAAFANEADPDWNDFPFEIEGSVSNDSIATAKDQWHKIPKKYRDIVINNGVTFLLTDKEAEEYYYGCKKAIIAFYNSFSKRLVLESKTSSILRGLMHEVGHALDDYYGFPSHSKEWINIFETEKWILPGAHSDDASEFFADVFKLSIKAKYDPLVQGELDRIPLAAKYMDDLMGISEEFGLERDIEEMKAAIKTAIKEIENLLCTE